MVLLISLLIFLPRQTAFSKINILDVQIYNILTFTYHPANMHSFFRIIVSDITSESKLIIPKKFVRSDGEKLRERVLLKTPGGAAWAVDVEREKGEVSLQNGWPEFATFYSISFGTLLVFDYMGHCNFQVRVFDTSATEIYYPNLNDGESVPQMRKIPSAIDDSSSCELIMPRKKTRASSASQEAFHDGPKLKQEKANRDGVPAGEEEKDRALASANAFKSNKPFFIVSMKPTNVVGRKLNIPKTFRETFRKWKTRNHLILQVAERSWAVDCTLRWDRCTLTSGWIQFIRDNSLNVGDVCVFELINSSRKLFVVSIFRAKPEDTRSSFLGVDS